MASAAAAPLNAKYFAPAAPLGPTDPARPQHRAEGPGAERPRADRRGAITGAGASLALRGVGSPEPRGDAEAEEEAAAADW